MYGKLKRICRFCLSERCDVTPICPVEEEDGPTSLMVTEVLTLHGLLACRMLMLHSCLFRRMCRKAETTLKEYITTGKWKKEPLIPKELVGYYRKYDEEQLEQQHCEGGEGAQRMDARSSTSEKANSQPMTTWDCDLSPKDAVESQLSVIDEEQLEQQHCEGEEGAQRMDARSSTSENANSQPMTTWDCDLSPRDAVESQLSVIEPLSVIVYVCGIPDEEPSVDISSSAEKTDTEDKISDMECDASTSENANSQTTDEFPCKHCNGKYELKQLLDVHLSKQKRLTCSVCNLSFFRRLSVVNHMSKHEEREIKCAVCGKKFMRLDSKQSHENKFHIDSLSFHCAYCKMKFFSKDEMEDHTKIRHTEVRNDFECDFCKKSFSTAKLLMLHATAKGCFHRCKHCPKQYSIHRHLGRHLVEAHCGKEPYSCQKCTNRYASEENLQHHLRYHPSFNSTPVQPEIYSDCSTLPFEGFTDNESPQKNAASKKILVLEDITLETNVVEPIGANKAELKFTKTQFNAMKAEGRVRVRPDGRMMLLPKLKKKNLKKKN